MSVHTAYFIKSIFVTNNYALMDSQTVTCPSCKNSFSKKNLKRNCSNCFACTGCEVYICYHCGERIVIVPPREYRNKKIQKY